MSYDGHNHGHTGIPVNPNSPLSPQAQEELSKEVMKALVAKQLAGQLPPGLQPGTPQPSPQHQGHSHFPHGPAPEQQVNDDVVKKMDTDETLRVENLLLKDQIEKMQQKLEDMRRVVAQRELDRAREALQEYLLEKHEINKKTHRLIIDPATHTLTVKKKQDAE